MEFFSQLDPRWSHIKLGSSNLSIGRWGCAFTSLINLWMAMSKKQLSAKQYIALAQNPSNFTDSNHKGGAGLVLWERVCATLGGVKYVGSGNANLSKIATAIRSPKGFVVVSVNKDSHFVSAWGMSKDGAQLTILDPLGAKKTTPEKANYKLSSTRYFEML